MKAGYCHYHKYTLTFRQMRNHGCLRKKNGWCKRFEPNMEHPWWQERLKRRSKVVGKPFIAKMERRKRESTMRQADAEKQRKAERDKGTRTAEVEMHGEMR